MQEKIEITKDFLVESSFSEKALKEFDTHFPKGSATVPEFLKKCEELDLFNLAQSIISKLPQNPEPLVLDEYSGGNIFYNGDIYIKKGVECSDKIICQKLFVDDALVLGGDAEIHGDVDVKILIMSGNAEIHGDVDVKILNMSEAAEIHGDVDVKILNMSGGAGIYGDVDVKTLNMRGNAGIFGDVDVKTLNMSEIAGIYGDGDVNTLNSSGGAGIYGDRDVKTLNMSGD